MTEKEKYYSGVGSRETPEFVCRFMTIVAGKLEAEGLILRSGGAGGADTAFEAGVKNPANKRIYLPKEGFEKNPSPLFGVCDEAIRRAKALHPLKEGLTIAKGLHHHARNFYQVLGKDFVTPSEFVLCWTDTALKKGGTRTAIKIAEEYNIPVLNLIKAATFEECISQYQKFRLMYG